MADTNPNLFDDPQRVLRGVLDTNVVMALWHFDDPKLAALATYLRSDRVALHTREDCLGELQRVLAYVQFAIEPARQQALYADYAAHAKCIPMPTEEQAAVAATLPRCADRDDQKFLTLAWDAEADVLVTRDKLVLKLARRQPFRGRIAIVTPERLQQQLLAALPEGQPLKSEPSAP